MKKTYTAKYEGKTFTRKSDRTYTHAVIFHGLNDATYAKIAKEDGDNERADWCRARAEKIQISFTGNLSLARKLAASKAKGYANVTIVELE